MTSRPCHSVPPDFNQSQRGNVRSQFFSKELRAEWVVNYCLLSMSPETCSGILPLRLYKKSIKWKHLLLWWGNRACFEGHPQHRCTLFLSVYYFLGDKCPADTVIHVVPQELSQLRAIRVCRTKARSIFLGDVVLAGMLSAAGFISLMSSFSALLPCALGDAHPSPQLVPLLGSPGCWCGSMWLRSQVTGHGCKVCPPTEILSLLLCESSS